MQVLHDGSQASHLEVLVFKKYPSLQIQVEGAESESKWALVKQVSHSK